MNYNQPSIRPHIGRISDNDSPLSRAGVSSGYSPNDGMDVLAYTSPRHATRVQAVTLPAQKRRSAQLVISSARERFWLVSSIVVTVLYCVLLGSMLNLSAGDVNLGITAKLDQDGRWVVSEIVPTSLGYDQNIQPGDIVVERDGLSLPKADGNGKEETFTGARELVIQRAGDASVGKVDVRWDEATTDNSMRSWAYSLLGLIFIGVGGPVFAKARERTAASTFYVFCIATASALAVSLAAILGNEWLLAAMFAIMVLWAGSFAVFFFKFPVRIGKNQREHNIAIATVVVTGVAIICAYLWVWNGHSEDYAWVQPLYYIYLGGCIVAGLVSLGRSLVAERSPEIRQQLILLLGGTAFAVGPSVILGLVPSLIIQQPFVHIETTALALGIMPLAFAYAITQHQLLGVRSLVRRGVVYVITGSSVLLVFSVGAAGLRATMPDGWVSSEFGLLSFTAFVFLIAISFGYLQRRVEHLVDRYIYHDAYDYKDALLQFSAQLAAEQNLHVLSDQLVERTCRMMNLNCGVLLLAIQPEEKGSPNGPLNGWSGPLSIYGDQESGIWDQGSGTRGYVSDIATRRSYERFDTRTRLRLPAGVDGQGGLIPYAKYGKGADWLVYSLQEELSQLGINLQQPGTNIHIIHFDDRQRAASDGRWSGDGDRVFDGNSVLQSGPLSLKGTLTRLDTAVLDGEEDGIREQVSTTLKQEEDGGGTDTIRAFLGVPLWTRSRFVGILCLGDKKTGERFSKDDLSLLSTLGSQAALAIYNAQLYETREQALLDTITALAHAIEAKDNYTINHCEKITGRAVALAEAMALSRQEIENIRLGSILHDVGKIGIPDAILNKPAKLTEDEYEVIKQHASIGARIVQSVGALKGVVPIVRHHQEKYDGSGYPDGLAGDQIPLGARIIGVVDTYGAMTEDRVYRRAPGHEAAIAELKRWSGRQFDPVVVDAFVRLLQEQPELAEV
jgi:putative nucleotidyltransferase with HDIG domain